MTGRTYLRIIELRGKVKGDIETFFLDDIIEEYSIFPAVHRLTTGRILRERLGEVEALPSGGSPPNVADPWNEGILFQL